MKKFCIATLTHNIEPRKDLLKNTIKLLVDNSSYPAFDWFVLINGYNDGWDQVIQELTDFHQNKINFKFILSEKNLGVGGGINYLNEETKDYEYTLFLEGDWYSVNTKFSGLSKEWIQECLNYLDNNQEISQVILRKYIHDTDDRMYGYGYWITPENVLKVDGNFIHLKHKKYTNNPVIRRTQHFFEKGIFPLDEFFKEDGSSLEVKGNPEWGQAEIIAEPKGYQLNSVYLGFGIFVHGDGWHYGIDWDNMEPKGCGNCKYGLIYPNKYWCAMCSKNNSFTYFAQHQTKYEAWLREMHGKGYTNDPEYDEVRFNAVREGIENPQMTLEELNIKFK